MDVALIAQLILAAAIIALICLPIGNDIYLLIFSLPWQAINIDLGVNLLIGQILTIALLAKYSFAGIFHLTLLRGLPLYGIILILGIISASYSATDDSQTEFIGGEWRNGWQRTLVSFVVFNIFGMTLFLVYSVRNRIQFITLLCSLIAAPEHHLLRLYSINDMGNNRKRSLPHRGHVRLRQYPFRFIHRKLIFISPNE